MLNIVFQKVDVLKGVFRVAVVFQKLDVLKGVFRVAVVFQKVDVMGKLVDELMARTHELLQPNPGEYITVGSLVTLYHRLILVSPALGDMGILVDMMTLTGVMDGDMVKCVSS